MRRFITRLVLPVTLLAFALFTKWWLVFVDDVGHEVMYGFPFIYKCDGWHTSLSTQYFILEGLADFLVYFFACFTIIYLIRRWIKFRIARTVSLLLWVLASLAIAYSEIGVFLPSNVYEVSRKFDVRIIESGLSIFPQDTEQPDGTH